MTHTIMFARVAGVAVAVLFALATRSQPGTVADARQATPAVVGCDSASPVAGMDMSTPVAGMDHGGMEMDAGTPVADGTQGVEFDQLYIDMMLPHHGSIVAMAEAALPLLRDEGLRRIAEGIIATQSAEQTELRGYREQFYGSAEPGQADGTSMEAMMAAMPGMGSMDEMAFQMEAAAQVAAICAAPDVDLAFIALTIPHHEMAITASESAVTQAVHPEIAAFARRVIEEQSAEIAELRSIRADLTGEATPGA